VKLKTKIGAATIDSGAHVIDCLVGVMGILLNDTINVDWCVTVTPPHDWIPRLGGDIGETWQGAGRIWWDAKSGGSEPWTWRIKVVTKHF